MAAHGGGGGVCACTDYREALELHGAHGHECTALRAIGLSRDGTGPRRLLQAPQPPLGILDPPPQGSIRKGGGGEVGWLVGCTTRLWRPVDPPPGGSSQRTYAASMGMGGALRRGRPPAPLTRPLSSHSLPPSPCRVPLVPAPTVSVPCTIPRTSPVSARHTLSPSPDMNLVSPAAAGSAIFWTLLDPILSFVPSQVLHEPAHHLRPTLDSSTRTTCGATYCPHGTAAQS